MTVKPKYPEFTKEMISLAQEQGEGWVQYQFINPCNGKVSPKSSFIKRVNDFLIGAGYYDAIVAMGFRGYRELLYEPGTL